MTERARRLKSKAVGEDIFLTIFFFRLDTIFRLLHGFFPGVAKHEAFVLAEAFENPIDIAHFGLGAFNAKLPIRSVQGRAEYRGGRQGF